MDSKLALDSVFRAESIEYSGPPPSYTDSVQYNVVIQPVISNASPPSYDSVFGRIRQERDNSSTWEFLEKLPGLLLNGLDKIVGLIIVLGWSIANITIAGVYWNAHCTTNHFKIYLLVGGIISIINQIITPKKKEGDDDNTPGKKTGKWLTLFLVAWFIVGSVWVYKFDTGPNYGNCEKTLFLYTFWSITAAYIIIAIVVFALIATLCLMGWCTGDG